MSNTTTPVVVPLTPQAAALQRLDDKLATGMTIADVANVRWLTPVEVLQYLGEAALDPSKTWSAPPSSPPTTGTLLLYDASRTPNYADDGIDWVQDDDHKGEGTWKSIEGVLAHSFDNNSDTGSDSDDDSAHEEKGRDRSGSSAGGSHQSPVDAAGAGAAGGHAGSTAMVAGAWAEYLSCATNSTFHRREYRSGPNNDIVLLHYLDTVRALRMTCELVDRLVLLSADSRPEPSSSSTKAGDPVLPTLRESTSGAATTQWCPSVEMQLEEQQEQQKGHGHRRVHSRTKSCDLGDTMNILMDMVEEQDVTGTVIAEALDEHVLGAATDAALGAIMKHVSPDEATGVVNAIESAMEEHDELAMALAGDGILDVTEVTNIQDVTALDIDDAIDQVLTGGGGDAEGKDEVVMSSSSGSGSKENPAKIIEDILLDSIEEVLPDDLQAKLINTTEKILEVKGISLKTDDGKIEKKPANRSISFGDDSVSVASSGSLSVGSTKQGTPLPEVIDITPDFQVAGHAPPPTIRYRTGKSWSKKHEQDTYMVLSTETPIPELPPFVDQYYAWEKFVAFVNFQEIADDPQVRNISFQRVIDLTPFSYKCKIPTDIPTFSIRHVVVVGVLLPKDHRVQRIMRGIELALKLCIQTEWAAAADLVGAPEEHKKSLEQRDTKKPLIRGLERPLFIAPCGGARLQLLTQLSRMKFTMYQATASPLMSNINQDVAMNADGMGSNTEGGREEKRKRDDSLNECSSGNDVTMPILEVDRHRKVRFVERISGAIADTTTADSSENVLDGLDVDNMSDDEVDSLLGKVLVKYVETLIKESKDADALCRELNYCGYAGLSLLHHASLYKFQDLISLLLQNGADPNLCSAEGNLTPLHLAAAAGHREVVDSLIRFGCNPCPIDSTNQTPANHAREAGHFDIAQALDSCYDPSLAAPGMVNDAISNNAVFLQSAFKTLSLQDKLGLNSFLDRGNESKPFTSTGMDTDDASSYVAFSFISEQDRAKLREAMSLASEMDLKELNLKAAHQDVRRYLRQSNYEAIRAANTALKRAHKKEADILTSASKTADDPSKVQLSRALAMLVLRKNLAS